MIIVDPPREICRIPLINHPITWYGLLFAVGFFLGYQLLIWIWSKQMGRERAQQGVEKLFTYACLGVIIGARLGHVFFYESPVSYLMNPFNILKVWEGGLASHGGVIGLLTGLWLFQKRYPGYIGWVDLLNSLVLPAALIAGMIRMGNFINQEVLGTETTMPWGVLFLHPADGSYPIVRHPVQFYEALFYWALFGVLFRAKRRCGLFLILVFTGRFLLEFLKEEQSVLLAHFPLTMGQLLSLPMIILGSVLWRQELSGSFAIKRSQGQA